MIKHSIFLKQLRRELRLRRLEIYNTSIISEDDVLYLLARDRNRRKLIVFSPQNIPKNHIPDFAIEDKVKIHVRNTLFTCQICLCNQYNASLLRKKFCFTKPIRLGLKSTIGTGDRIGLATPGHIRLAKKYGIFPVLAQQSIREMRRSSRTAQEIIDDVTWAVFQEGYQNGFAADADHLKNEEDIDETFEAGFTMYTIDPSDYVDDKADDYDMVMLRQKFKQLPWNELKCEKDDYLRRFDDKTFKLADSQHSLNITFSEKDLLTAAVKYSTAISYVDRLSRYLVKLFKGDYFDLEVSVDETEKPTSPLEHLFLILELQRLGVRVQSLALRFMGRFEKAIDYVGELDEFEKVFRDHALIARLYGPYKLGIHSGSDKFSIYPIIAKLTSMVHLKTAGTSYLEALRIVARKKPVFFREIVKYCVDCYEEDRKTYYIKTEISMIPNPDSVSDQDLEKIFLNQNNGRQLLHVTFGSILTARDTRGKWRFRDYIKKALFDNEEEFYEAIVTHFENHIPVLGLAKREEDE